MAIFGATKKKGAITMKIDGVIPLLRQLKTMDVKVQRQVQETLTRELASWVLDAQSLTPVVTGALQASGRLLNPTGVGIVKYQIIFGGVSRKGKFVNYAALRHEVSSRPKFLEKVVIARAPGLEQIIAKDMMKAIRSSVK